MLQLEKSNISEAGEEAGELIRCTQTGVESVRTVQSVELGRNVFFHCTIGLPRANFDELYDLEVGEPAENRLEYPHVTGFFRVALVGE